MAFQFETLGNATLQVFRDGEPILVTDPWLQGTCYYGSWALDHPLSEAQIANAVRSPFVWFSHGHPDHLNVDSLPLLDRSRQIFVSDHYRPEIQDFLAEEGFENVEVLRFKQWREIAPDLRIMALENENQDSMLIVEAGDTLIIDLNDSPMSGELPFLRKLVKSHAKSYLLALCSNDADMLNIVDSEGRSLAGPPEAKKPGTVLALSDLCSALGVQNFCCSSSQHIYARADTIWANPYRITWPDMQKYWVSKTRLIEPFVSVDCDSGEIRRNHPEQVSDESAIREDCAGDDWDEPAVEDDWKAIETWLRRFEMLPDRLDFVGFVIAGERRRFDLVPKGSRRPADREKGIVFHCPRKSLMSAVSGGYFDDLLIGNFMKTELINATMYPDFTPIVAKLGGNAKVFTKDEFRAFKRRYYRQSRAAWIRAGIAARWLESGLPFFRKTLRPLGLFSLAKSLRRRLAGRPGLPEDWPN